MKMNKNLKFQDTNQADTRLMGASKSLRFAAPSGPPLAFTQPTQAVRDATRPTLSHAFLRGIDC